MSKFLKGFIFGSVIGGAVALLNNPRSGKENREILAKQVQEVTQDITVINTEKPLLKEASKKSKKQSFHKQWKLSMRSKKKSQNSNWKINHASDVFKIKFKHCKHILKK